MSGLEVAGVVLGAFPLIISALEDWREVANVGGFFLRIRKEFKKCLRDVQYHEILYKRNLKALLSPLIHDEAETKRLIDDPGGQGWSDGNLQKQLQGQLQEAYEVYFAIVVEMNETAEELKEELAMGKSDVQAKLKSPEAKNPQRPSTQSKSKAAKIASVKSKWDYESYRVKFSFNEPVRDRLFGKLAECNSRLEKLLSTSFKSPLLQSPTPPENRKDISTLEISLKKAFNKADWLFKALQKAWQCSCQQYHYANLRLEHRTLPETCFEIILMFVAPLSRNTTHWSWKELQCGHQPSCSFGQQLKPPLVLRPALQPTMNNRKAKGKGVVISPNVCPVSTIQLDVSTAPNPTLCQNLGDEQCQQCLGIVGHDGETYHLHPSTKRKQPGENGPLTLDQILSFDYEKKLTRRQRYAIALLLASSVAQLQSTPWLRNGLKKEDVQFFPCEHDDYDDDVLFHEPFISQGFLDPPNDASMSSSNEHNFQSLGILLLELCFGRRLEDHPYRRKLPEETGDAKQAFDLVAALRWSNEVGDEGGEDYASAVKWCFMSGNIADKSWRSEIIKNVIRPLESCQEHFRLTASI
ncbi:hypothetical protein BU24DRAFT_425606 [Aaosphaeria arxii CBS 175.79]|uniref:DUF7580 domain-containing protein n=1 Tax=Aaosphaeria arxii CBS 175.79 TaxID=1450172 RepID=A0A6A5XIU0_9PLEO|nr:uncharacterized protein BU24DRAFT_425606 [Aaosphaeria arxii CBS 175.79]KAF2013042.1 hypothetical protein BU24DRAFT_425606 [Aaosphaeria arxii CBS 175.79]